jgi:hypothetical protein
MADFGATRRPLLVNFDLHTEGDPEFKQELIVLMIENLRELEQAFELSVKQGDLKIYRMASHKMEVTLGLLGDHEFEEVVNLLKSPDVGRDKIELFRKLSTEIIRSLEAEKK